MDVLKRIQDEWEKMSSTKRTVSLVIIASIILASIFFYRWITKVEYAPLFTNIQADHAGKIVEELKGMKIPYRLDEGGKTISVPRDQVYEIRLNLAGKGVVAEGGMGFELFDESSLGTTDFERNINYQRALQEELRRTIVQIDAVKQARVHLVLPERSAFIANQHKPQASVVVELKPMVKMQPEQVKAIAELVAGSVENLNFEDVKIVDTAGHILSNSIKSSGSSQLELGQMEIKKAFEERLESRIQQMLENIYGPDQIVTMVTANLDFNQKETDRTIWGTEGVITSEQITQKTTTVGDSSVPVGDPNRDPELTGIAGANNAYTDMSSIRNYEINKMVEKEIHAPGRLISISAAVVINGDLPSTAEARIKDVIAAAIGFDADRGDTISILSTEFDRSGLEEDRAEMAKAEAEAKQQEQMHTWMSWGLKALGIIAFFILALLLMRHFKPRDEWPEMVIEQPVPVSTVAEQIEPKSAFVSEDEKIRKIIKDEPEVAVQIINSWLEEGGSETNG